MKVRNVSVPVIGFFLLLAILLPATGAYAAVQSRDVQKDLMCQCGCTMVLDVCDCGTADQMRAKIASMISDGQDKGQILDYFVGQYGETVLAAPTKKGFNLIAWVGPFAAVIGGAAGLLFLLRAWSGRGRSETDAPAEAGTVPVATGEIDAYRSQLDAELQRFREEDGP